MSTGEQDTRVITACIDGSPSTGAVCDAAAWASRMIGARIRFLHVTESAHGPREQGEAVLRSAESRAAKQCDAAVTLRLREGSLVESLQACEETTGLFVIGRRGDDNHGSDSQIGAQVELVARAITRPILTTVRGFAPPRRFMLAYDGSEAASTAVTRVGCSPLLKDMPGHVVMVGEDTNVNRAQLEGAAADLRMAGHDVTYHLLRGDIVDALMAFRQQRDVGITVMGAYGHSRMRRLFVGSHTERMIRRSVVPLLLLR